MAKSEHPHVAAAEQYARRVGKSKTLACKWVRLACARHLKDRKRERQKAFLFYFDPAKAERACKVIELFHHTKGRWAAKGLLLTLEPWQCFFICCIFGWVRKADDLRRFRKVVLLVPRKNGKSQIAAAIGLYMLAYDGEHGAEVYSGATTEKQAWEVFRPARIMANKAPEFCQHFGIEVNASNINILDKNSRFEPIIGKPGDGASPSCAIIDEYHEHDTDEQFDAMETGQGAREQPLMLVITTAGSNMSGPCYALQLEAQKMLEGVQDNDSLFALVYTVDRGDNWTKLATLKKANPNFGVSVGEEFLITRQREAIESARKQGTFQTKHLNIWVGARNAFFNVQKWIECHEPGLALEQFEGHPCILGMDLASKIDLAAIELLFPRDDGSFARFGKYYLPETTVAEGENEHYRGWMLDGWLTVTDGAAIDFRVITRSPAVASRSTRASSSSMSAT